MTLKAKLARASLMLLLCLLSAVGAAWRFTDTQAQEYPESAVELRANGSPQPGQPYVVDVYASIAAPTYGFGLQVNYDPTVLQLEPQVDAGGSSVPMKVVGAFETAQRIRNNQEAQESVATIDVVYTLLPPAEPVRGEGYIGQLTFTVLQAAPTQLELISPRLIALIDGAAIDLPVVAGSPLDTSAAPAVAELPAVTIEMGPVTPVTTTVDTVAPAAAAPIVESAPQVEPAVLEPVITSVNTSDDILLQMTRNNQLMNAVAIGLLTLMAILLGVISISTLLDARDHAHAAQLAPAHAYNRNRAPARKPAQSASAPARPAQPIRNSARTPRDVPFEDAPTMPSRTQQMSRLLNNKHAR